MLNPDTPLCNTIIMYIIIIVLVLLLKPEFMYCKETNRFKQFGLEKGKTIISFPIMCMGIGIILYMIFMLINIICKLIN